MSNHWPDGWDTKEIIQRSAELAKDSHVKAQVDKCAGWTCWRDGGHRVATTALGWPQCQECGAAPAYHERPAYLPRGFWLALYVPIEGSSLERMVKRGSAIVGPYFAEDGRITVHYEGWVNGPMQYADRDARGLWEAGVQHAAGRLVAAYPTIALASVPIDELVAIGSYDPRTRQVSVVDETALRAWLEEK